VDAEQIVFTKNLAQSAIESIANSTSLDPSANHISSPAGLHQLHLAALVGWLVHATQPSSQPSPQPAAQLS
jgi:hypothetical protein